MSAGRRDRIIAVAEGIFVIVLTVGGLVVAAKLDGVEKAMETYNEREQVDKPHRRYVVQLERQPGPLPESVTVIYNDANSTNVITIDPPKKDIDPFKDFDMCSMDCVKAPINVEMGYRRDGVVVWRVRK